MTIKQSAAIFAIFASIALAGAGCVPTGEPSNADIAGGNTPVASTACPEETVRYSHADAQGRTLTFCYEKVASNGTAVRVVQDDDLFDGREQTILYSEANEQWSHTVTPIWIGNAKPEDYVRDTLMTAENRAACEVLAGTEENETKQIVIAGGDLDAQEKCGTYKDGMFLSRKSSPGILFYVTVGQDTFMPSGTWMQTLAAK